MFFNVLIVDIGYIFSLLYFFNMVSGYMYILLIFYSLVIITIY